MIQAGITGGIGSGKSIVSHLFALLGIPVYNADNAARKLMETDPVLRSKIQDLLSKDVYLPDGTLNRKYMSGKIFQDPILLKAVNESVHPCVMNDYKVWLNGLKGAPYVLFESAILIETGLFQQMNLVIVVDAPESLRVKRIIQRDQRPEKEVNDIISRQWSSELIKKYASFVIENDEKRLVIPQVLETDQIIRHRRETGLPT